MENVNKKYIVCFMDILGYKSLVTRIQNDPKLIDDIKNIYDKLLKLIDGIITREIKDKYQQGNKTVAENIKFRIMSDSIIVTMCLDDLPMLTTDITIDENRALYIGAYFQLISMFYITFVSDIRYFFRGAITVGQYYESELNKPENIFVVSEALVRAFECEQKMAESVRVIIDVSALDYFKGIKNDFQNYIFKDIDGLECLDIYLGLPDDVPEISDKVTEVIENIINVLNLQIQENHNDSKILRKYYHFIQYHNWKMKTRFKNENFVIKTLEYENLNKGVKE
ncbi:MAG: hypothetical protein WC955_00075 [Elusimicrobiota bacterium]